MTHTPGQQLLHTLCQRALTAAPYALGALAVLGVAAVCAAWWRSRQVTRSLADRAVVELVPTTTFDPSEKEVANWAQQLSRVRYAARLTPARGAAARVRYTVIEGRMRCFLEGPATAAAVLALPGFAEVDVRARGPQKDIQPVRFSRPVTREGEK